MTDDKGHASPATRPGRMQVDIRVAAPFTGNFFMAMHSDSRIHVGAMLALRSSS